MAKNIVPSVSQFLVATLANLSEPTEGNFNPSEDSLADLLFLTNSVPPYCVLTPIEDSLNPTQLCPINIGQVVPPDSNQSSNADNKEQNLPHLSSRFGHLL